jgi:hypothetical protein
LLIADVQQACGACNAFAVGELLFFAGPKKSNQKKGPSAQEHTLFRCGQSRIFGLAIHGSTENGARPARRPPGLDAQGDLEIVSSKSRDARDARELHWPQLTNGVLHWRLTLEMPTSRNGLTTRRAASMDGRRFQSSHGWRV